MLTLKRMRNLFMIVLGLLFFYVFDKDCRSNLKQYGCMRAIEDLYSEMDEML